MRVGILIIVHKPTLSTLESVSLCQCARVLGGHPIHLLYPRGMDTRAYLECCPALKLNPFSPLHFSSYRKFNRFKIQPRLYESFSEYEYVLFYELDAFVFQDQLDFWCDRGFDYIGAPWFVGGNHPTADAAVYGVGNGGLSLRKVESIRRVQQDWRFITPPQKVVTDPRWIRHKGLKRWFAIAANITTRNHFHWAGNSYKGNEDFFWGLAAARRFEWWKTADYASACHFSFEHNAPRLYRETDALPFGCHKWNLLHQDFWRPHLEKAGADLPDDYGQ